MDFVDFQGRRYVIPDEVLAEYEVKGDLPELPLTGLEAPPGYEGVDEGSYCWLIQESPDRQLLQYVVSPAERPVEDGTEKAVVCGGVSVLVKGEEIVIRIARER
jgi:hypothetical protein